MEEIAFQAIQVTIHTASMIPYLFDEEGNANSKITSIHIIEIPEQSSGEEIFLIEITIDENGNIRKTILKESQWVCVGDSYNLIVDNSVFVQMYERLQGAVLSDSDDEDWGS